MSMRSLRGFGLLATVCGMIAGPVASSAGAVPVDVTSASIDGKWDGDKARLVIEADLGSFDGRKTPALYAAKIEQRTRVRQERLEHTFEVRVEVVRGALSEVVLPLSGAGEVLQAEGDGLKSWGVRRDSEGGRALILRVGDTEEPIRVLEVRVNAETRISGVPTEVEALGLTAADAALGQGYVRVDAEAGMAVEAADLSGLVPLEVGHLPESMRSGSGSREGEPLAFRFFGTGYRLPLKVSLADPEARQVSLKDFELVGDLTNETAVFTLTAVARVRNPKGGTLSLLAGDVALRQAAATPGWMLRYGNGGYEAVFERGGDYPLRLDFNAAVRASNGWNRVRLRSATAPLAPVVLRGLGGETELEVTGGARPEADGGIRRLFLGATGDLELTWRPARPEAEGRLFYSVEGASQVGVSPGLMRLTSLMDLKVMQGELSEVTLRLRGAGEITRVQGAQVLAWSLEPVEDATGRRLRVRFNQPQRDRAAFQVEIQQPLGSFPLTIEVPSLEPEGAIRFGGQVRVVNEGAVRLEVVQAAGLSQISPEQFIQTEEMRRLMPAQASQVFAYRFAGMGTQLQVRADNILPELAVSQVVVHRLGETELIVEGEFEVDVREAPLREMLLRIPTGYSVASLRAAGMADYFVTEATPSAPAMLRLVYGEPVSGRQVVQLRLEQNRSQAETRWELPKVEVEKAKSVRGHVGVVAEPGFRLTPATTSGLTEVAPAFFPRKVTGLQLGFRISDAGWQAVLSVERLAQSIQADALHLFSVGEGIAYGSSLINYVVSGAPVGMLAIELSGEYFNVEFTGKNIRNWQKTERGYDVQLHTPVSGAYTLLATYERPFQARGETLGFTGVRPLGVQSEQGYTLVVSTYQFQVRPADVSPSLLALEPGEVPAEYRLFFDAPILAAYRYAARPFNLQLALAPLTQGEVVSQVIDRAALTTRISEEGQVVTEARYFVKNKGAPHLRLQLPAGAELWSVLVDGSTVVPVRDADANLIPLPHRVDPDVVTELQVKMASRSSNPRRLTVMAPRVGAPVLLADWRLEPATGRRLVYRGGTLTPEAGVVDVSGFAGLTRLLSGRDAGVALAATAVAIFGVVLASLIWSGRFGGKGPRWGAKHVVSGVLGLAALVIAVAAVARLGGMSSDAIPPSAAGLHFVAPVQHAGAAWSVTLGNQEGEAVAFPIWSTLWFVALAVGTWVYAAVTERGWLRRIGDALGWTFLFWATLRMDHGVPGFLIVFSAFVLWQVVRPAALRWWNFAPKGITAAPVTAALVLIAGMVLWMGEGDARAQTTGKSLAGSRSPMETGVAESVIHDITVDEDYVLGRAQVRWKARQGQVLPVLDGTAVLTRSSQGTNEARLIQISEGGQRREALVAQVDGEIDFELEYQTRVVRGPAEPGFYVPVPAGLTHRARLTLPNLDVDVVSPQAVSMVRESEADERQTVANVVWAPSPQTWVGWRPRTRDARRERAVFFAEWAHVLVPSPGVVDGVHELQVRPAQGEISELTFVIPTGATITDVTSPALSFWRFDPDAGRLRVSLSPAPSRSFSLLVRSQVTVGPLPLDRAVGLPRVEGAAGQVGLVGVATGAEVQLEEVTAEGYSAINLEDFPGGPLQPLMDQIAGLTVRRAFRHGESPGSLGLKASAVEPDVRVESQQTLSLSEDRTVLAAVLEVEVNRAGIFKMSFPLPGGLDLESASGPSLSHWTELKTDTERSVTLHLRGKTLGKHTFNLTLTGAGVRSTNGWTVPRLTVREATKQRGQLMIVPEQGLRLQTASRSGVSQLDPAQVGIRQKGVLAFRLLQDDWDLLLDLEQVDAWVQVTGLQHVVFAEAQAKVAANLQYEIENTGVKSLVVRLPAGVDGVHFSGEQVSDFVAAPAAAGAAGRDWEVKLERRLMGRYLLHVTYTVPLPEQAREVVIDGIEAQGVNLQRGFVTLQAGGRLQARTEAPAALQPTEWQVIPRALLHEIAAPSASYAFRLVEPTFRMTVQLDRHEAARLLPARVQRVALNSVLSDDGAMLTRVEMVLASGDKRLLHLRLPEEARFWFAFVDQRSVWPWQSTNQVLLPLERSTRPGGMTTVEFFYSSRVGEGGRRDLDLNLQGPRFDLPLEDITWTIFLNKKWKLEDWHGTLQLQDEQVTTPAEVLDLDTYVRNESNIRQEKTKEAEQFLNLANSLLQQGDPGEARRAFQAAYGMSQHDQAFNEDARVQLNNLRMQQALVGLNFRQARVAGESEVLAAAPRGLRDNQATAYTQAEAKQILGRNSAEDNAVQSKLAERLIQQQDAAVASPAAIRTTLPEQGRRLTFTRPLDVNTWSELRLNLEARAAGSVSMGWKLAWLAGLFTVAALLLVWRRSRTEAEG